MEPVLQPDALRPDSDIKHPVTIDLEIKASVLYAIAQFGIPSQSQIDNNTQLGDGTVRSGYGSSKADFTVTVYPGSSVTWEYSLYDPTGSDSGYSLQFMDIAQENTANNHVFFDGMPLQSRDSGATISAIAKTDQDLRNTEDTYSITFTITNPNGQVSRQITMDPKLRMNPTQ